ncbi:hypothetical protein [Buttiauxella sp.]|uniref:hypothetical protein n=1 Tax=Buttiauxella sp. TaxID=1972222 RepID=UPI003C74F934
MSDNELTFTPDKLSYAVMGQPYTAEIKNSGSNISSLWVKGYKPHYQTADLRNGLVVNTYNPESNWNIKISGTPNKTGTESFTIEGFTSGTQCPGLQFSKTYTITTVTNKLEAKTPTITVQDNQLTPACRRK